jgi:acyl carrier protein
MDSTQARLANCFLAVFPDLSQDQVLTASSATVPSWDSVAGVTLMAVVEEEFDIAIDADDLSRFNSFDGFLAYLRSAAVGA